MAEKQTKMERPNLALAPREFDGVSSGELIAIMLSLLWLVGIGAFFVFFAESSDDGSMAGLQIVMTWLAILMPVAIVWLAAGVVRTGRVMREESRRLQSTIDVLRLAIQADRQGHDRITIKPEAASEVEKKLAEIAQSTKQTEAVLATFTSSRQAARPALPTPSSTPRRTTVEEQPVLALGTPVEEIGPPLSREDLIRAMNFPDNENDKEGFGALRRALRDRTARQLIQASQDVLTLLSQDGIYMDDLRPDRARPEVWRRFAKGERGRAVASLGGIRDRSSLALTAGRMREDTIFRDSAHHFLRLFDRTLTALEVEASDEDISDMSETRTARAFMLLGRATGAFD